MKIRSGFVSNSSSSSFIVIDWDKSNRCHSSREWIGNKFIVDGLIGKHQFGWEIEDSYDFGSKVCFAYIQAMYMDYAYGDEGLIKKDLTPHIDMLEKVLYENLECSDIIWNITIEHSEDNIQDYAYIDHNSSAVENENIEIFEDEDALYRFLFLDGSYIHTDNDNH